MTTQYNWRQPESFKSWAREPKNRRSLLDGAFLVAPIIEPAIDLRAWSIVTRGILRKCIANAPPGATPVERFHEARKLMQERFRLEGDLDDFYNPFNICIHKVLTRGLGVPVSLGIIWMALGRLCGLDAGNADPGHFMMRFSDGEKVWFVDPFHPERTARGLPESLLPSCGQEERVSDAGWSQLMTLMSVRMLALGLEVLSASGDYGRALMVTSALLELEPSQPRHFQRRASLFEEMETGTATDAWESCLYSARSDALRELVTQRRSVRPFGRMGTTEGGRPL